MPALRRKVYGVELLQNLVLPATAEKGWGLHSGNREDNLNNDTQYG